MSKSPVCGMFISDIHWSEKPPTSRSEESNWIQTQEGYMIQLEELWKSHNMPPIFIAGDLFAKWDSSPFIINHVLKWLNAFERKIWAIPGNHDLPNHNYTEIMRSAYWTLAEAGVIKHLTPGISYGIEELMVTPFPHGFEVCPPHEKHSLALNVALVHDFIWTAKTGHENAPEVKRWGSWEGKLKDYDCAFFGDNHHGFLIQSKKHKTWVLNCGTFMRRYADEKNLKPCVGLLHQDKSITRHYLDTELDKFIDMGEILESLESGLKVSLAEFAEELSQAHTERLDFTKAMVLWMEKNQVDEKIKEFVLKSMGVRR